MLNMTNNKVILTDVRGDVSPPDRLILEVSATVPQPAYFTVTRSGKPFVPDSLLQNGQFASITSLVIPPTSQFYVGILPNFVTNFEGNDMWVDLDSSRLVDMSLDKQCSVSGSYEQGWTITCN
eukprot:TRINITY_DN1070_c0_g1_i1.p1 TRINITY_DN1070_c0_g1~~TRINITY_DN1070_c0_g1_i1.p1  ORF type:complete len:123 (+),score=15.32 TRINITY_DN1070_c0_g1_i1:351-719(+)